MASKRNTKSLEERVDQLLAMAWNTKSTARTLAIVNQILEIDPGNLDALVLKADNTQDADERLEILMNALEILNTSEEYDHDSKDIFLYILSLRLAITSFYVGKFDDALKFCEAALNADGASVDPDEEANRKLMKSLYYRLLIERREWQKILSETMKDEDHSWAWGYSRLIAAWMLAQDNTRYVCANMFWDVLSMSPDIPFYLLGYFAEPDDGATQEEQLEFDFALMYYDALSVSDEFFNWFTRGTILFGLLTGRFEEREREYLLDVLDSLGGYEEYEKMSGLIVERDDEAVIEMLAANKCLTE